MSTIREHPILFSAPMVRAILDSLKTQTRRVVRLNDAGRVARAGKQWHPDDPDAVLACPYGQHGDRVWVRETFMREPHPSEFGFTRETLPHSWDYQCSVAGTYRYRADPGSEIVADGRIWTPSIHMPRAASRITLEVTGVRVERLQDISEADAIVEGIPSAGPTGKSFGVPGMSRAHYLATPREAFWCLWESINGPNSWSANPWVWVVEFRRIEEATA